MFVSKHPEHVQMNAKIKQLAEQASHQSPDGYPVTIPYSKDFAEKFAELIVRECINKVSEWDMGIDDPVGATDNTSEVARDMVAEIKEHFGVEE
jgi:hypothetical protein